MSIFKNEKSRLIKRGKELGLNLDPDMAVFDMKAAIFEAENKENVPKPKPQPSQKRGEY